MTKPRGILFVLSGASGVGKGTILALALSQVKNLEFSVSWTTRECRQAEVDGKDYHFKSKEEFLAELNNPEGGFLEHAEFVGQMYGTPRRWIEEQLAAGTDVILDIELDGAMQLKTTMPEAVFVLMVPPNLSELHQRLLRRGTENQDKIERRLKRAVVDMQQYPHFDYVIVNNQYYVALDDLLAIIRAERLKVGRIDAKRFSKHWQRNPALDQALAHVTRVIENRGP